jgi:hypothetical protein
VWLELSGHNATISAMEDREPEVDTAAEATRQPSLVFGILVITSALSYISFQSPHPWSAFGLACMTASALIATPELLKGILQAGGHPRAVRIASVISRGLRRTSFYVYGFLGVIVVVVAAFGQPHVSQAIGAAFLLGALMGVIELAAWEIRVVAVELVGGGRVDREIGRRFGAHRRWPLAGVFFLAGTLLQLVGTFVE